VTDGSAFVVSLPFRLASVLPGIVTMIVLRESVFDDAQGDVSLGGNVAAIGIVCAAAVVLLAGWRAQRVR
jgi:hypothetical protein